MITNSSKNNLILAFNQVVNSMNSLIDTLADEGRRAFVECRTDDLYELSDLMIKVHNLNNSIIDISDILKTYALDIATDKHPAVFPLSVVGGDVLKDEILSESNISNIFPLTCHLVNNNEIVCKLTDISNCRILAGSKIKVGSDSPESTTYIEKGNAHEEVINGTNYIVIDSDIKFRSLNSLLQFALGKSKLNPETEFIGIENGLSLSEMLIDNLNKCGE